QSSPEIDEDRLPNPLLKSGLAMSPRQRKKVSRTTPTMKGTRGGDGPLGVAGDTRVAWLCPPAVPPPWGHGDTGTQKWGGTQQPPSEGTFGCATAPLPLAPAGTHGDGRQSLAQEGAHIAPEEGKGAASSQ
uniref:Uncharacterized protein n=1 Tax=Anas zonorhyncha TaxID=75864 RepID=A0A8B9USS5_9AVES